MALAFYLIMNVAVGGTNGWFPDNIGDKPWLDQSESKFSRFLTRDPIADSLKN